ncbi:hypothetical protein J3R83DRAFT_3923 [Lanmaoa asiatica]|nr:hypothetical protein J3R83DRAFT_3923 [Lanmaoa asiatica]
MASATAPALRQFTFFDIEPVKDVHDSACPPDLFKNAPEISAVISSSHGLVVADIHGSVHLLNQAFVSVASWIAHVGGRVTHMVEEMGILISIGDEDDVRSSILKIWDLGKIDKRTGAPVLLRTAKVQPTGKPHPVTTLALTSSLSFLSVGLADGTVLLYRHLDQSLSPSASIPKPRVIHEIATEPVTFLAFTTAPALVSMDPLSTTTGPSNPGSAPTSHSSPTLSLVIVTTSATYVYPILPKPSSPTAALVDEIGASLRCACVDWKARWVVLGRDEAVVGVGSGGRLGVVSYEGRKSSLYTHLNYVVVVLPASSPTSLTLPSTSITKTPGPRQRKLTTDASSLSNVLLSSTSANVVIDPDAARVVLIDMENKMVAYVGIFERGVRDVVSAWGSVYVLGNDGAVTRLVEKPTGTKLALLYEKHLYPLALSFAYTQNLDTTDVHRHHGDYLYEKGDYDGAMKEYLQTIGGVRGSYVVRKFLTANLTPLLMLYLQELHTHGLANAEHTTLLLNTYAKVGDVAKVDAFVRSEGRNVGTVAFDGKAAPGQGTSREPPFDLDTAIRVCRQAGFFEQAAYLAKRWGRHEDYLRVVVEDIGAGSGDVKVDKGKIENGYSEAVSYLREVGGAGAESNLARYCRALLDNLPNETTQLLIDLCTISGPLPPSQSLQSPAQGTSAPSYLALLALSRAPAVPPTLTGSDGAGKKVEDKGGEEDLATALAGGPSAQSLAPQVRSTSGLETQTPLRRPSPTLFFAHFVDHPGCFTTFLETESGAVAVGAGEDEETEKRDQAAVWNTLLELYLDEGIEGDQHTPHEHHKALQLLHSTHLPYDLTHALVLCSSHQYTPGLILLWEKMGMFEDVLRFWMEEHNSGSTSETGLIESSPSARVISALRKYGPDNPHLYPLVLRFLTSTPALLTTHQTDLESLLEHIESEKIMSPLSVVQVLSRNEVASVGLVKGWLMRRIKEGMEEITTDQQLISSYRSETRVKLKQVEDLEDTEHPRVFHVTRCSQCNGQLDLPSIHFMCNHSYHQRSPNVDVSLRMRLLAL